MKADLIVFVSLNGLWLCGQHFFTAVPLSNYGGILGPPTRTIDPGPPAPYPHRNNQIHIYDHLGIYLNEHHVDSQIQEIVFVLEAGESTFPIKTGFSQGLRVCDFILLPGMREKDFPSGVSIVFQPVLRGIYKAEGNKGIRLGIRTIGHRTRLRRRTKERYIVEVSVGFSA